MTQVNQIGQFTIYKLLLTSFNGTQIDLRGVVHELSIFEDLFGFGLSGNLLFGDSKNLLKNLPIIGQERLEVEIGIDVGDGTERRIRKDFDVFKVTDRAEVNFAYQIVILDFVAPETSRSLRTKISRAYAKTHDEIVKDILTRDLKTKSTIVTETSKFVERCVIPNWSPMEAIQWISRRAVSNTYNNAGFFCYENTAGEFVFTSMENLVGQAATATYSKTPAKMNTGGRENSVAPAYRRIESINFANNFNTHENIMTGMYASRLYTFDPIARKYSEVDFSYAGTYNRFKHLEQNELRSGQGQTVLEGLAADRDGKMMSEYPMANTYFQPKHTDKNGQGTTANVEWWYQQSISQSAQFNVLKGTMIVNGDPARKVGEVLNIEIQSTESLRETGERELDPMLSGRYLVTAIGHRFSFITQDYKMAIESRKDSLSKPLPTNALTSSPPTGDAKEPVKV